MANIDELIEKLGDKRTKERLEAANELADIGEEAVEPVTQILLENPDYTYRRIAAYILGKIGHDDSIDILIEALGDDTPDVRKSAAQALKRIGDNAIPALVRSLGNISKDVRASSVWALSKMGESVIPPLVESLKSDVKDVRASAVWALSNLGKPSVDKVFVLVSDDDKNVRESAIWCLAKIGEPAISRLAEIWDVRLGKVAMEGESETDSVDLEDLLNGGVSSIKHWIKFMLAHKENEVNSQEPNIDDLSEEAEASAENEKESNEDETDEEDSDDESESAVN